MRLRRRRVREATAEEKEAELDDCMFYVEDVEEAFLKHGRRMVINVDETAVRNIVTRRLALARRGEERDAGEQ